MVILKKFSCGPFQTNAYLLICPQTHKGAFIDPAPDSYHDLSKAAQDYKMEAILITHSHWDHMCDTKKLKSSFEVPIYVHKADSFNLSHPGSDGLPLFRPTEGVQPDCNLVDGQILTIGHLQIQVIHTPGHTPGGVCFYLKKEKILISGDTLFKGAIGNLSFPTANPEAMWKSLKILGQLPKDTHIYPGHGSSTTIGAESHFLSGEKLF